MFLKMFLFTLTHQMEVKPLEVWDITTECLSSRRCSAAKNTVKTSKSRSDRPTGTHSKQQKQSQTDWQCLTTALLLKTSFTLQGQHLVSSCLFNNILVGTDNQNNPPKNKQKNVLWLFGLTLQCWHDSQNERTWWVWHQHSHFTEEHLETVTLWFLQAPVMKRLFFSDCGMERRPAPQIWMKTVF